NSWIQSPVVNVIYANILVEFDSWVANETGFPCAFDVEFIEISTDNGLTWTPLHGNITGIHNLFDDGTWRHFSLPWTVLPNSSLRIRFRFDSGDDCCGPDRKGWFIDNFVVRTPFTYTHAETNLSCYNTGNGSIIFPTISG